ncbi:DUF3253 domain-containing protein [Streptomyces enissocaesilis]|uniref:Cutinase n=1 Tax=Streptomyces enissocaesilis TaxID=332589 RepID=A0ABP6K585_9ACTN
MTAALAGLLLTAGLSVTQASTAQAATAPCGGTYTIVVGGTGSSWHNDNFTGGIQQHVGYPTQIPNGASARACVNELNRLVRDQRAACPGQHVKMGGYSLGAAVVHIWITENWQTFDNVNAILIADPKRQAGPGANGGSVPFGGIVGALSSVLQAAVVEDDERQMDRRLERAVLELSERRDPRATICPSDAARAVYEGEGDGWRALMEPARRAVHRLVEAGEVEITQGGSPVEPSKVRSPIRVRRAR